MTTLLGTCAPSPPYVGCGLADGGSGRLALCMQMYHLLCKKQGAMDHSFMFLSSFPPTIGCLRSNKQNPTMLVLKQTCGLLIVLLLCCSLVVGEFASTRNMHLCGRTFEVRKIFLTWLFLQRLWPFAFVYFDFHSVALYIGFG